MRFTAAIDLYVEDMNSSGRFNSARTEVSYRHCLQRFSILIGNRDPRTAGRDEVKAYLRDFPHPNTQMRQRSMLVSFFDWAMQEGHMKHNPARQTRPPKQRKARVHRLTLAETRAFLAAAHGPRERRVAFLGVFAGLRREEIRLLQGRHFSRPGVVWVTADIGKGSNERWIPVLADLEDVIAEIRERVADNEFILPAQQFADPPFNKTPQDYPYRPGDGKTIWRMTRRIGERAGIPVPVNPHMMRHAFADHIARGAGVLIAQRMLGHADLATTQRYLSEPTIDDLTDAVAHLRLGATDSKKADLALVETVGFEPTKTGFHVLERETEELLGPLAGSVGLYLDHYRGAA